MLKVMEHALLEHHLQIIRNKSTIREQFQNSISQISTLLLAEVMKNTPLESAVIDTPITKNYEAKKISEDLIFVPILRAGLAMVSAVQNLIPRSRIGHIGMYRDEVTKVAHAYLYRMPKARPNTHVIVLDPMLATGNSSTNAIQQLVDNGYKHITFIGILGVKEGVQQLETRFGKDFPIYLGKLDPTLDERKFIVPGLGDAGDRAFGTVEEE